ncbi:hypothetical protein [Ruegeria lacuscaerulensis]|uniref:hypothetical protein n=1 Tax=Ruegeria lacuscaerulensis TaxID=55218 RepID=UPI00147B1B28|nr:hypothetical protein [Ruegeria lacuscaerulensis]
MGWACSKLCEFLGDDTPLSQITVDMVNEWAGRPKERADKETGSTERGGEGFNREMGHVKAVLTAGAAEYHGPRAWEKAQKIPKGELAHRKADADELDGIALSVPEIEAVIGTSTNIGFARFAQAMFLTLQRVQSLRMADVRDFDADRAELTLRYGKNAAKKDTPLVIPLFADAVEFFQGLVAGRSRWAPLITDTEGNRLEQDFQRYPMKWAVKKVGLPKEATLYAIRRGAITHAVESQATDLLTISQMSDVDPNLILKHYFKRTEKLGRLANLNTGSVAQLRVVE